MVSVSTLGAEYEVDGGLMMHERAAKEQTKGCFCSTVRVGLRSSYRLVEGHPPAMVQLRELAPACNVDLVPICGRQVQRRRGSRGGRVVAVDEVRPGAKKRGRGDSSLPLRYFPFYLQMLGTAVARGTWMAIDEQGEKA